MSLRDLYTEKQIEVLTKYQKGFRLMINYGAKRSGKTVVDNDLFLMELKRVRKRADLKKEREPQYILAGVSSKTIAQNVLNPLRNKYGLEFQFDKHGNFNLFGVKVVLAYTGNISGLGGIRGMTAYGAYVNEASLANKFVFKEIIDRCSDDEARIICDTNPDNPQHYLKVDYLDNDDPDFDIVSTHFTLEDNTFLGERYIRNQKAGTPLGMMYDRDILGLWVSGEGLVYAEFDKNKMTISSKQAFDESYERFFVGVDWGFNHKTVFTVMGYKDGVYTLMEEYAESYKQIEHWIDVAKDIKSRFGNIPFYCDTANPEHIYDLKEAGIRALNANKNVMNGIEYVAGAIHNNRFRVVYDECPQFRKEIYNYAWNEKTGEVVKKDDDCMDSMRYAMYNDYLDHLEESMSVEELAKLKKVM